MKFFSSIIFLFFTFLFSATAQNNCNCPPGTEPGYNLVQDGDFSNFIWPGGTDSDLPTESDCEAETHIITWDANQKCPDWAPNQWDHTTGWIAGRYLVAEGFYGNNDPSTRVWFRTVPVINGLTYNFKFFWRPTLAGAGTANTTLNAVVNGQVIGSTVVGVETDWNEVCFNWVSTVSGNVEISIDQANNFVEGEADFGIDDIRFTSCTPVQYCYCPAGDISTNNQIVNSDFSGGNTGFGSDLALETSSCQRGRYLVSAEAIDKCQNWTDDVFDHTTGDATGSYLIIDGWVDDPSPSSRVWFQNVSVTSGTYYEFDFWWLPRLGASGSVASLSIFIDGVDISGRIPQIGSSEWQHLCYAWEANQTGTVEVSINQVERYGGLGFDYGLDDLSFRACSSEPELCSAAVDFEYIYSQKTCQFFFTNLSTPGPNSTIIGYEWSFGDGTFSTEENPSHLYNYVALSIPVCLTVYSLNDFGECCTDTYCEIVSNPCVSPGCKVNIKQIFVTNVPQNCTRQFNAQYSSYQPVTSFLWDFGDGTTSSEENPIHTFPSGGSYNVCLTILSSAGEKCCSDKLCTTVNLWCFGTGGDGTGGDGPGGDGPGGDIGVVDPGTGPECNVYSFFSYSQDTKTCEYSFYNWGQHAAGTTIVGSHWDFGDGYSSDEMNPTHFYPGPGSYNACLTIYGVTSDGRCCTDVLCRKIYNICEVKPCKVSIENLSYKSSIVNCGLQISAAVTTNRPIVGYYWDFGDGTTQTGGSDVLHIYPNTGTYNVCLTVVAKSGEKCCTATECRLMSVNCGHFKQAGDEDSGDHVGQYAGKVLMSLYPNPTNAELNVSIEATEVSNFDLNILDLQGRSLLSQRGETQIGINTLQINSGRLAPGTYFVRLIAGDQIQTEKLIVQ